MSCSPSRTLAGADTAKQPGTLPRRKAIFYTMSWMRSFEGAHFAEGSDSDDEENAAAEAEEKAKMAAAAERPANSQPTSMSHAVVSHDPRGLVDTTPGGGVNEETAALARELSAGGLAASRTELNLKKAGLSELSPRISALASLTKLDVSLNGLKSLPSEVAGLASLRILFSLGNLFEEVPPVLRGLPSLYMLSFKSNKVRVRVRVRPGLGLGLGLGLVANRHPQPSPQQARAHRRGDSAADYRVAHPH